MPEQGITRKDESLHEVDGGAVNVGQILWGMDLKLLFAKRNRERAVVAPTKMLIAFQ